MTTPPHSHPPGSGPQEEPETARVHPFRPARTGWAQQPDTPLFTLLRRALAQLSLYLSNLAQLWRAEMKEEGRLVRSVLMMVGAAAMLLVTSFALLTVALVGVIAYGLDSWRWSLLIVGVAYGLVGALLMGPALSARRAGIARLKRVLRRVLDDFEEMKRKLAA